MRRMFIQYLLPLLLIPAWVYTANAQCPASTPLVINSITPTESRCAASGSATVSASGGSAPYTYSITAGPVTAAAQSSNVLQSLPPGTYTVAVTDNCNTSVTGTVTIAGTYTIPAPTATTQSTSCPGSSDGSLTVSAGGDRTPLAYSLVSPSPVTAAAQASNVFTGLPAGTYTYQVTDSCGNFQTRTATVNGGSPGTPSASGALQYRACDSFAESIYVFASDFKPPYTVTVTLPNGNVMTSTLPASAFGSGFAQLLMNFRYHHTTGYPDPITITVTSNCGSSYTTTDYMYIDLDMRALANSPSGCGSGYSYNTDFLYNDGAHCSTLTYTLISPAGDTLATQTNDPTFSGYPPGNGYKVIRQDCCEKDSLTFNWSPPPSYSSISPNITVPYGVCNENTTTEFLEVTANYTKSIVLVSGPPSVTFLNGTVYNYTYPDTINDPQQNINVVYLSGLTAGTYKVYDLDICGGKDSTTFTINPGNLRQMSFTASGKVACAGGGSLQVNATGNNVAGSVTVNGSTRFNPSSSPFSGSVDLTAGTYDLVYNLVNPDASLGLPLLYPMGWPNSCDVLYDTVVVPGYTQPAFSATPAIANCGSVRDVALLPDTTSGLAPYEYQIISGPTTTAAQSSPVFTGLSAGTYTFQMTDACPNSYSRSVTIDTLAVPGIVSNGSTCAGNAATLTLPASPFYTYSWQHPDGTSSTGDTLSISPVTAADTGSYTVTVTSTVGGCSSTSSTPVYMGFCTVLDEAALDFTGQRIDGNIRLNWRSADATGIQYYTVSRSEDGITFEAIQELPATGAAYSVVDTHPPSGTVFYRLQITDKSGAVTYSQTLSFDNGNRQPVNVHPTVITGNIPITVTYPPAGDNRFIRVIGADGTIYRTLPVPAGSTQSTVDVAGLAGGMYFVTYAGNGSQVTVEVWKE